MVLSTKHATDGHIPPIQLRQTSNHVFGRSRLPGPVYEAHHLASLGTGDYPAPPLIPRELAQRHPAITGALQNILRFQLPQHGRNGGVARAGLDAEPIRRATRRTLARDGFVSLVRRAHDRSKHGYEMRVPAAPPCETWPARRSSACR